MFVKVEDGDDTYLFLSTITTDDIVDFVEFNKLSVRGAFVNPHCWVVETDFNYRVTQYWPVAKDCIPSSMLPKEGVGLRLGHPRVPDSIEQAKAFFSVAFRGASIASGRMPFNALK